MGLCFLCDCCGGWYAGEPEYSDDRVVLCYQCARIQQMLEEQHIIYQREEKRRRENDV